MSEIERLRAEVARLALRGERLATALSFTQTHLHAEPARIHRIVDEALAAYREASDKGSEPEEQTSGSAGSHIGAPVGPTTPGASGSEKYERVVEAAREWRDLGMNAGVHEQGRVHHRLLMALRELDAEQEAGE